MITHSTVTVERRRDRRRRLGRLGCGLESRRLSVSFRRTAVSARGVGVVGSMVVGGPLSVGLIDRLLLPAGGFGVVVGVAGPAVFEVIHIVQAGLVVVAVLLRLPARRREVIGGPRIGRIILMGGDPVFGMSGLVGLVGVPGQQVPQPGLVRDDPERFGPADPDRILITVGGQTVRDPSDQGLEGGHIPGLGPGDQGPQPILTAVGADIPLAGGGLGPGLVGRLIHPQQGRVEDVQEPGPGHQLQVGGGLPVQRPRRQPTQVPGRLGDLGRLPPPHLPVLDPLPQQRQPMPDRQRVRYQLPGREHRDLQCVAELGGAVLRHQRGAHPTGLDVLVDQRSLVVGFTIIRGAMTVSPRRSDQQLPAAGPAFGDQVVRGQVQQRARVRERLLQP